MNNPLKADILFRKLFDLDNSPYYFDYYYVIVADACYVLLSSGYYYGSSMLDEESGWKILSVVSGLVLLERSGLRSDNEFNYDER